MGRRMNTYVVIFLTLFLAFAAGTFAGLLLSANLSWGNFVFAEPGKDIVRCLTVGLVTAGTCIGLLALTSNARVLAALFPVWFITIKLCWLEIEGFDILFVACATLVFVAVGVLFAVSVLR